MNLRLAWMGAETRTFWFWFWYAGQHLVDGRVRVGRLRLDRVQTTRTRAPPSPVLTYNREPGIIPVHFNGPLVRGPGSGPTGRASIRVAEIDGRPGC
jgi:hypothetical protein